MASRPLLSAALSAGVLLAYFVVSTAAQVFLPLVPVLVAVGGIVLAQLIGQYARLTDASP